MFQIQLEQPIVDHLKSEAAKTARELLKTAAPAYMPVVCKVRPLFMSIETGVSIKHVLLKCLQFLCQSSLLYHWVRSFLLLINVTRIKRSKPGSIICFSRAYSVYSRLLTLNISRYFLDFPYIHLLTSVKFCSIFYRCAAYGKVIIGTELKSNNTFQAFKQKDERFNKTSKVDYRIDKYLDKCIQLCWLMCVHDPPMILTEVKVGETFPTDHFTYYEKNGTRVKVCVWPALLAFEGGPLIRKGSVYPQ